MPDLLVEVGCEELPSSACREIIEQAPGLFSSSLEALGLAVPGSVELSVAPRRFALVAPGLPEGIAATARRVRGPSEEAAFGADGAPTRAAEGFARGQGVAVGDLVVAEENGRRFVFAERREEGRPVDELVPEVVARLIGGLRFSKTMRWGDGTGLRFSRPVRWIVAKVDERTVPFELHGLVAGDVSQGHRFLGAPAEIRSASAYHEALEAAAVIADHERRRARIVSDLDAAAAEAGAIWRDPGGKLDEVVFLVEWPSVVTGGFDARHLALPPRVLVTAMQGHQRYFPLEGPDGALRPAFLAVSNGDPAHADVIARGYADVLDARLQDAEFSFERDREAGLEALDARLDAIVFHARLGSMADKRDRLVAGVADIAAATGAGDEAARAAAEAARLAKVDQGAVLVAEFSELQGYAAAQYARLDGVDEAVALAVEEQYLPEGPDSPLPASEAGAMLAAAEKVDNLVGAFAVGEAPTGSKDPYGLRRAAAGLVRISLARDWDVDPCDLLRPAYARLGAQGAELTVPEETVLEQVVAFLADRLAYLLAEEGVGAEAAAAAMGARLGGAPSAAAWARAIEAARAGDEFAAAWTAATRLARIARKGPPQETPFAPGADPGEDALHEAVEAARPAVEAARAARDFPAALRAAAGLGPAVDRFFTDVLVNAEDPAVRARRYALVREAAGLLEGVADFERVTDGGRVPVSSTEVGVKRVYDFSEGSRDMRDLLGGKGANVAEMTRLGLPVPKGFTITTETCIEYLANDHRFPEGLDDEISGHLAALEGAAGRRLGDAEDPLLVSVRSGAKFSMPGMMDTVLNLGLNDRSVEGLAARTGNPRFAYDSYRRFIQMFGDVVAEVDKDHFERALSAMKAARGVEQDVDLTADDLRELVTTFTGIYEERKGEPFPQEPRAQLDAAVRAVFESWDNRRARDYRRLNRIPHDLGTAVNVQQMVFGNTGPRSGTGVAFTRSNVTGERGEPFGDFLINAQGEDVVAGIRTPRPLAELADELPEAAAQLNETMEMLERTYRNMQDVEFTIEDGALYMLQTRNGKRSAQAMARIAVDMLDEGIVNERESLTSLVDPDQIRQLLLPQLDAAAAPTPLASGVAASPGAAAGAIVFTADEAEARGKAGEQVILVRDETTPDDFHGMIEAQGILTARGGKTSHAAIVAVGMGKPAVCGVTEIRFAEDGTITIGGTSLAEGDRITIDGTAGTVFAGDAPLLPPDPSNPYLLRIIEWADRARTLRVRTNADTPEDAVRAREFGAEGIGLCRTEHMFQGEDRLPIVQRMILAGDDEARVESLALLRTFQEGDFEGIFRAMAGLPVTIRLLDPPLHEFLPSLVELSERVAVARATGTPDPEAEEQLPKVQQLHEVNPMLGTRGCRLGIEWPDVYRMQVAAIMSAACTVKGETGEAPLVEIMIPLVGFEEELRLLRDEVLDVAETVLRERGERLDYLVGTMIELPRAALLAAEIARQADFFSFGTNDLTQTVLGFSRDDAENKFLTHYLQANVITFNPFETIDQAGVGALVAQAVVAAREAVPGIKLGVCGEHGGDPASVMFFHGAGLDYVSCSPFRVQTAIVAAGRAAVEG